MKYLIQLKDARSYVAPSGSELNYTTDPKRARQYPTFRQAKLCALANEVVVSRPDALRRNGAPMQ